MAPQRTKYKGYFQESLPRGPIRIAAEKNRNPQDAKKMGRLQGRRPKFREETPKEGGGNARYLHCRAAAIWHRNAQKARGDFPYLDKADAWLPHGADPDHVPKR